MAKRLFDLLRHRLALAWSLATDRRLPWRARAPAMLALAYVASPVDLLPDALPGVGWLDDVLALVLATAVTPLLVPRRLLARHLVEARRTGGPARLEASASGAVALPWLMIATGVLLALAALLASAAELGSAG